MFFFILLLINFDCGLHCLILYWYDACEPPLLPFDVVNLWIVLDVLCRVVANIYLLISLDNCSLITYPSMSTLAAYPHSLIGQTGALWTYGVFWTTHFSRKLDLILPANRIPYIALVLSYLLLHHPEIIHAAWQKKC